jgi:anti-anti-sigma factor
LKQRGKMKKVKELHLDLFVNGDDYRPIFNSALVDKPDVLLLDMQKVTSMDSSGLGAIISALKKIRVWGGQVVVCSPSQTVIMLLQLTNTCTLLPVYQSYDEFLQSHAGESKARVCHQIDLHQVKVENVINAVCN